MSNIIYLLHSPESDFVYVGQSSCGMIRPRMHKKPSVMKNSCNTPLTKWIRKRLANKQMYSIAVLEQVSSRDELDDAEVFFIAYFRSLGMRLLNCTVGGGGTKEPTEEFRHRLSERQRNRSESHRQHLRIALAIRNSNPLIRQQDSDRKKGIPLPPLRRERLVAFNKKNAMNPDFRRRHAERMKDPEVRAKIAAKKRGQLASPATKKKMSLSHLRRHRFQPSMKINLLAGLP